MVFSIEIGTAFYNDWIHNNLLAKYKCLSVVNLEVNNVNYEINYIVYPNYY